MTKMLIKMRVNLLLHWEIHLDEFDCENIDNCRHCVYIMVCLC